MTYYIKVFYEWPLGYTEYKATSCEPFNGGLQFTTEDGLTFTLSRGIHWVIIQSKGEQS